MRGRGGITARVRRRSKTAYCGENPNPILIAQQNVSKFGPSWSHRKEAFSFIWLRPLGILHPRQFSRTSREQSRYDSRSFIASFLKAINMPPRRLSKPGPRVPRRLADHLQGAWTGTIFGRHAAPSSTTSRTRLIAWIFVLSNLDHDYLETESRRFLSSRTR